MNHAQKAMLERASKLSSASLHEAANKTGALPSVIRPLALNMRMCGPALPVICSKGDNLFLHHAIAAARPGDVIVADVGEGDEFGYWGEIMCAGARARGVAGLVLTGGVRDTLRLIAMDFPVFSSSVCIGGTVKNPRSPGGLVEACSIGRQRVERGDIVFGDADGVVVLPAARADEIVSLAERRDREEAQILERLRRGETTLDIYKLPVPSLERDHPPQRRRSVEPPGLRHGDLPIPAASRVGNLIATGGIRGVDAATGRMPEDLVAQARNMFANLRTIVDAAGGRCEDIVKLTVWIATPEARAAVNAEWVAMFPDPHARPARHILNYELPAGMLIQCEAIALASQAGLGGGAAGA